MRAIAQALISRLLRLLPLGAFVVLIRRMIALRLRDEPAPDALRAIFTLDNWLYTETGRLAIDYDDGRHAKHRLTGYVSHFADLAAGLGGPYLDLGCGNGELAHAIATRVGDGVKVVGVDIAEYRIAATKRLPPLPNLSFMLGDATAIDLPHAFKTVILSNVLEHIEDRPGLLRRIAAHVGPDAILIRVPVFDRDWRVPLKKELGLDWRLDDTHFTEYTNPEFGTDVAAGGFRIRTVERRWGEIWAIVEPATTPG